VDALLRSLAAYPYLAHSLIDLLILLAVLAVCPAELRRRCFACGIIALPAAAQAAIDTPGYWTPARIISVAGVGPEDLIFCFTVGALGCLASTGPIPKRVEWRPSWRNIAVRLPLTLAVGAAARLAAIGLGAGPSAELIAPVVAAAAFLLALEPRQWLLGALGVAGFTPVYTGLVAFGFHLFPSHALQWNPAVLWGTALGGVPLAEIAWAAAFGAAWPLTLAAVFGLRLRGVADVRQTPTDGVSSD
jgi:hypothetical protein